MLIPEGERIPREGKTVADTAQQTRLRLVRFEPAQAPRVASWVRSDDELFWLAPGTQPPITAEKVLNWTRRSGNAYAFTHRGSAPVGYGELNPLRRDPRDLWIGHVIIDPARRGQGLGRALTDALIHRAFKIEGAHRLTLVVFPENAAAVQCYRSAGFRLRGTEHQVFGPRRLRYSLLRFELTPED